MVAIDLELEAGGEDAFYFYHETKPYELSFEIITTGYFRVAFEECDVIINGGVLDILECTNRYRPRDFDLEFGWTDDWGTNVVTFIDGFVLPNEFPYTFGRDELTFVCAPDKYYVVYIENVESSTEVQNMIFYVGEV